MSERHDLFRQFVKAQRGEAGRRRRQGRERAAALLREALHKSGVEPRLTRDTPVEKTLSLVQGSGVADAADCLQQAFQVWHTARALVAIDSSPPLPSPCCTAGGRPGRYGQAPPTGRPLCR